MGVESWDLNPGSLTLELTLDGYPLLTAWAWERKGHWAGKSQGQGDSASENGAALSAPTPTWKHGAGVMW